MNDALEKAINSLGAICEIAGFMREQLMNNGFTREEACDMALSYIIALTTNGGGEQNG